MPRPVSKKEFSILKVYGRQRLMAALGADTRPTGNTNWTAATQSLLRSTGAFKVQSCSYEFPLSDATLQDFLDICAVGMASSRQGKSMSVVPTLHDMEHFDSGDVALSLLSMPCFSCLCDLVDVSRWSRPVHLFQAEGKRLTLIGTQTLEKISHHAIPPSPLTASGQKTDFSNVVPRYRRELYIGTSVGDMAAQSQVEEVASFTVQMLEQKSTEIDSATEDAKEGFTYAARSSKALSSALDAEVLAKDSLRCLDLKWTPLQGHMGIVLGLMRLLVK